VVFNGQFRSRGWCVTVAAADRMNNATCSCDDPVPSTYDENMPSINKLITYKLLSSTYEQTEKLMMVLA